MKLNNLCVVVGLLFIQAKASAELYIGVSGGYSAYSDTPRADEFIISPDRNTLSTNEDNSNSGYNLYLGYEFLDHYAVEVGYSNFGSYNVDASGLRSEVLQSVFIQGSTTAYSLSFKARKKIAGSVLGFLKAGISEWHTSNDFEENFRNVRFDTNLSSVGLKGTDKGSDIHLAMGVEYSYFVFELGRQEVENSEIRYLMCGVKF